MSIGRVLLCHHVKSRAGTADGRFWEEYCRRAGDFRCEVWLRVPVRLANPTVSAVLGTECPQKRTLTYRAGGCAAQSPQKLIPVARKSSPRTGIV